MPTTKTAAANYRLTVYHTTGVISDKGFATEEAAEEAGVEACEEGGEGYSYAVERVDGESP